jgi:hypothetical protein
MKKPPDRYPGDPPTVTIAEVQEAVRLAEKTRALVLKLL